LASASIGAVEGRPFVFLMRSLAHALVVQTPGRGLFPFTDAVRDWVATVAAGGEGTGLLSLFCRHTSASLLVQENADPEVLADLSRFFLRLVPDADPLFRHTAEGPDDMPAHVRAALTQVHLSIPVVQGQLTLGTWQGIYLFEHRLRPHRREVVLQYLGT
jgi:secondary thiamine-phosphate synthase enzyme